ncbi:unnamed protein product, partial [Ectocarpus fasciculatus]
GGGGGGLSPRVSKRCSRRLAEHVPETFVCAANAGDEFRRRGRLFPAVGDASVIPAGGGEGVHGLHGPHERGLPEQGGADVVHAAVFEDHHLLAAAVAAGGGYGRGLHGSHEGSLAGERRAHVRQGRAVRSICRRLLGVAVGHGAGEGRLPSPPRLFCGCRRRRRHPAFSPRRRQ